MMLFSSEGIVFVVQIVGRFVKLDVGRIKPQRLTPENWILSSA